MKGSAFNSCMNLSYKVELSLFVFITYLVTKAAGSARGGSTTLVTETVGSPLVGG